MEKEEVIEIIDYFFEKLSKTLYGYPPSFAPNFWQGFGHELAVALKDVLDKSTLVFSGDVKTE